MNYNRILEIETKHENLNTCNLQEASKDLEIYCLIMSPPPSRRVGVDILFY